MIHCRIHLAEVVQLHSALAKISTWELTEVLHYTAANHNQSLTQSQVLFTAFTVCLCFDHHKSSSVCVVRLSLNVKHSISKLKNYSMTQAVFNPAAVLIGDLGNSFSCFLRSSCADPPHLCKKFDQNSLHIRWTLDSLVEKPAMEDIMNFLCSLPRRPLPRYGFSIIAQFWFCLIGCHNPIYPPLPLPRLNRLS